jgi:hypothetical protein
VQGPEFKLQYLKKEGRRERRKEGRKEETIDVTKNR